MLTKQLKLTSDQQSKVQDILKSEQSQMEALHSNSSPSQDDRRSKMMEIRKASTTRFAGFWMPTSKKNGMRCRARTNSGTDIIRTDRLRARGLLSAEIGWRLSRSSQYGVNRSRCAMRGLQAIDQDIR